LSFGGKEAYRDALTSILIGVILQIALSFIEMVDGLPLLSGMGQKNRSVTSASGHKLRLTESQLLELLIVKPKHCKCMLLQAFYSPFRITRGDRTKTLLVMRLTSILLLAGTLQLSAKTVAQRVTLSEQHSSLGKIFKKITDQTGVLFVYRDEWLRQTQAVDIDVKDASLQEVLISVSAGSLSPNEIVDQVVVLKKRPPAPPALTDEQDLPPPGVD